jgi:hypothetical protein
MINHQKHEHFGPSGAKIRSQHSVFGPVQRIAGDPGRPPRWQASLCRSWNRYERRDEKQRSRGRWPAAGAAGNPRRLTLSDVDAA